MNACKRFIAGAAVMIASSAVFAQVSLSLKVNGDNVFPLVDSRECASLYYDEADFSVIKKSSELFADDVQRVTGKKIVYGSDKALLADHSIIVGTVGHNRLIDEMVSKGQIDTLGLTGRWESYVIQLVKSPLRGVKQALVIAGSDRRGTAYGLLSVSRAIGVSPWYWWADVPVRKQKNLYLAVNKILSKEPSVKYRGIFINDEDWGLYRWAKLNFEKERGNFGPKTYAKVCELLLRLQANYLCPAMHDASMAFHRIPENRLVADSFAIVMGSSHCEPLLFNTASEWNSKTMGEWDYVNNRSGVDSILKLRVEACAPFENVYTLALRGLHDKAMKASNDMSARKDMLQEALMNQRKMLADVTGKPANEIPQAFTPYKEVLDVYDEGLELPDDVTIIWPDDNYGYMKRLSSPKEQKRSGRSGVYYHASYLGKPHDHLWMNTTSPALMYEELRKAYDMTADRIWLLNAGDIKSCEFAVDFFLEMAYDIDSFSMDRAATYRAEWLSRLIGDEYEAEYADVWDSFYRLAFVRRPEFMGWGYQWATDKHGRERNTDTDFSLTNYREADRRLAEYRRISDITERIYKELPEEKKACFYQIMYYPVKGCELLNRMVLDGQRNRWYAIQQRAAANRLADAVKVCYDSLNIITQGYNDLLGGKWNHVMTMKQGFAAAYFELPKLYSVDLLAEPSLGVMAEQEDLLKGAKNFHSLPCFSAYLPDVSYYVDVFNKGSKALKWKASVSAEWILLNKYAGNTFTEDRIEVSVDWKKAPLGERVCGVVEVTSDNGDKESVWVSVFNPPSPSDLDSLYVETNGYVSIDAAGFHRKVENDAIKMMILPNLGVENVSVQMGNPTAPPQRTGGRNTPRLEYDFYTFEQGSVDVYTYVLPTFVTSSDRGYAGHEATNIETKYGVCIDEGPVMNPSTSSFEYAQIWYESVLKNCRVNKTTLHIDKPGKHTVKIICGDAGTVLQKIVLDFGGMKRSYSGPLPTRVMKK